MTYATISRLIQKSADKFAEELGKTTYLREPTNMRFNTNVTTIPIGENIYKGKEVEPMKSLYRVVVVTKQEEIIMDKKVVAVDEDEAKFNAGVHAKLTERGIKPKDVTVICGSLGAVKVEKEIQKVQVVK